MSENNNGDWFNDFMDYKMSSGNTSGNSSGGSGRSGSGFPLGTIVMLFIALSFISGKLPINGLTGIIALVCAGILVIRFLGG